MYTKPNLQIATKEPSAGAIPEIESGGVTMAVCVAIVGVCFAAPLFLTLPQAMDAAASPAPAPVIVEAGAPAAFGPTMHERYPVKATSIPESVETF